MRPKAAPGRNTLALAALLGLATALAANNARSDVCHPESGISPCIDADALWAPTGVSRFAAVDSADTVRAGYAAVGMTISYLSRPLVLVAPSPDPHGREVFVIDQLLDVTLLTAYGVTRRLELGAALPFAAYQTGSGVEGATTQNAPPINRVAVRDPRVGAAFALYRTRAVGVKGRLDITLPLGDEELVAGGPSFTVAPAAVCDVAAGRFFAASSAAVRLRETVELADAVWGSQLVVGLGTGLDILSAGLLSVALEAQLAPVLASQARTLPTGTVIDRAVIAPAEWWLSVSSRPARAEPLSLLLAGGTGLPLSTRRRTAPDGEVDTDRFFGPTSPAWRAMFSVRWAPSERAQQ